MSTFRSTSGGLTSRLTEDGGPLDLSKGDGVIGEGGVDGVEARWLENLEPDVRDAYKRAKGELLCSKKANIRLARFLPTHICPHRYHPIPIPIYTGKGSIRLVIRAGLRRQPITLCRAKNGNHFLGRWTRHGS